MAIILLVSVLPNFAYLVFKFVPMWYCFFLLAFIGTYLLLHAGLFFGPILYFSGDGDLWDWTVFLTMVAWVTGFSQIGYNLAVFSVVNSSNLCYNFLMVISWSAESKPNQSMKSHSTDQRTPDGGNPI